MQNINIQKECTASILMSFFKTDYCARISARQLQQLASKSSFTNCFPQKYEWYQQQKDIR